MAQFQKLPPFSVEPFGTAPLELCKSPNTDEGEMRGLESKSQQWNKIVFPVCLGPTEFQPESWTTGDNLLSIWDSFLARPLQPRIAICTTELSVVHATSL